MLRWGLTELTIDFGSHIHARPVMAHQQLVIKVEHIQLRGDGHSRTGLANRIVPTCADHFRAWHDRSEVVHVMHAVH